MTKVLITGGLGFIGSHLSDKLVEKGYEVVVFDNRSTKTEDIRHYPSIVKAMTGVDIVFHLAAELEILVGLREPTKEALTNINGTINVLHAAMEARVKKVVSASSVSVYGEPESLPMYESHPKKPLWTYGITKLAGEHYCDIYRELYGLETVSLRYSIVYGPREWYRRVLTKFTKAILDGKKPVIFGTGSQTRDFVHVSDVVRATIDAAEKPVTGAFNIASGEETSVHELAEMLLQLSGRSPTEVEYANPDVGIDDRKPREQLRMQLEISKAKRELGWEPQIPLKDGLAGYLEYYRRHSW